MKRAIVISLAILTGVLILSGIRTKPEPLPVHPASNELTSHALVIGAGGHPCYKHSIVPCGVWSPPAGYWLTRASGDYYTSYSINGMVYWTRKPVHLSGEFVWTNGKQTIRARCGNGLSTTPVETKTPAHVDTIESEIDTEIVLPAPDYPGIVYTSTLLPVSGLPPVSTTPLFPLPPVYCCSGIIITTPGTPVRTPEPSGMLLIVTGLLIIAIVRKLC